MKYISEELVLSLRQDSLEEYAGRVYEAVRLYGKSKGAVLAPIAIKYNECTAIDESGTPRIYEFLVNEDKSITVATDVVLVETTPLEKLMLGTLTLQDVRAHQQKICEEESPVESWFRNHKDSSVQQTTESNRKKISESLIKAVSALDRPHNITPIIQGLPDQTDPSYKGALIDRIKGYLEDLKRIYDNAVIKRRELKTHKDKIESITNGNVSTNLQFFTETLVEELGDLVISIEETKFENFNLPQLAKIHDRIVSTKYNYELGLCLVTETIASVK